MVVAADTDDAPPPDRMPAGNTYFLFQHKVFNVAGAYFALSEASGEPTFFVPLGDITGVLSLPALLSGFDIKPDSADAALLKVVEKALGYVRRIQPGDSIPRELLDGSASWDVDDRHLKIAVARLALILVARAAGSTTVPRDRAEIVRQAGDPSMRERMPAAAAVMADMLKLGRERAAEVLDRLNRLGRELSYIEALRDHLALLRLVAVRLQQLGELYGPERGQSEQISRVLVLIKRPLGEFDGLFQQIDARVEDLPTLLADAEEQVTLIRLTRDDLHRRFMPWDDLIARWKDIAVGMTPAAEALLRDTYSFVARRFPQGTDWALRSGAPPGKLKKT